MANLDYLDFDLTIRRSGDKYQARVFDSPGGQAASDFTLPFSDSDLQDFLTRLASGQGNVSDTARTFGGRLFAAVFTEDVRVCLRSSQDEAARQKKGLRIRLHLDDAPELARLPWEFLYSRSLNRFLSLSAESPVVRYLELAEQIRPLAVEPPLKVLAIISNPSDQPPLNVDREWAKLKQALGDLEQRGKLTVERLGDATLATLQKRLRRDQAHILHFIGHGVFDEQAHDGVLMFEDERGTGRRVTGNDLGTILHDQRSLRLVILNACEGAVASSTDPFSGAAQSLIQQGIPAVIAMQFEISDSAAITFSQNFYDAMSDNYPVDGALAEARKAIFATKNEVEWATPVLYMRAPDGRIFEVAPVGAQAQPTVQPQPIASPKPPEPAAAQPEPQRAIRDSKSDIAEKQTPVQRAAAAPGFRLPVPIIGIAAILVIGIFGGLIWAMSSAGNASSTATPTLSQPVAVLPTLTQVPAVLPTSSLPPTKEPVGASQVVATLPTATVTPTVPAPAGKIALSVRLGEDYQSELQVVWIMNADGTGVRQVLKSASQPGLSPDGSRIAYYHWTDGLYVANADGSDAPGKRIVGVTYVSNSIAWSNDGSVIAFTTTRQDGSNAKINFVGLDGKTAPNIAINGINGSGPAWSPKGPEIAFNSCAGSACGIFVANSATGQDAVPITRDNGALPAWSPSGDKIVYQAPDNSAGGRVTLFIVNSNGSGGPKPLFASPSANRTNAVWSPDGNFIFYRSSEGGSWGIWRVDSEGKNPPQKIKLAALSGGLNLDQVPPVLGLHESALSLSAK